MTTTTAHQLRFEVAQFVVVDCYAPNSEALADFLNAANIGATVLLISASTTSSGDPHGSHVAILREEIPQWELAAETHGVYLVVTDAPIRFGTWDGDITVQADPPDHLIIEIPN